MFASDEFLVDAKSKAVAAREDENASLVHFFSGLCSRINIFLFGFCSRQEKIKSFNTRSR